ncbi:hypothetical protein [Nitrospina gracilis]|uniref:hypothetical protein n=1 Tax=Nitrospina gracilis TaxID=35801 RepID=UPI001F2D8301|nr:hypothetical protein [Nitrospina gracilis]MCF8719161.1 hypothetical protein [Nitrospina gracilis Nb-211]
MDPSIKNKLSPPPAIPASTRPHAKRELITKAGWGLLILYLFLLTLGAVGELFGIEAILNLSLFLPPGKF